MIGPVVNEAEVYHHAMDSTSVAIHLVGLINPQFGEWTLEHRSDRLEVWPKLVCALAEDDASAFWVGHLGRGFD